MLLAVNLDSENASWLREHMASGDLPNLAALARSGVTKPVQGVLLNGIAYQVLYTGQPSADLGLYFPVQWVAEQQKVVNAFRLPLPETLFERIERHGRRLVVVDPPECARTPEGHSFVASGIQFRARNLLHSWSNNPARTADLLSGLGPPPRADEIFGGFSIRDAVWLRKALLLAPDRLRTVALRILREDQPDCLWINCCGLHVAGHQFFALPMIRDRALRSELEGTRLDLAKGYDRMLGSLVEALPPGSAVLVFYTKGMAAVKEWSDLLPDMIRRVLSEPEARQPVNLVRWLLPRSARRFVAARMSDERAMDMLAELWSPRADWRRTQAFALPTDAHGFVRLNLRGRERDGIVPDSRVRALKEQLVEGLQSFTDLDGEPCIDSISGPSEYVGEGRRLDCFPDLIVRWRQRLEAPRGGLRSARFGDLQRRSDVVGRAANHTPEALAIVAGRSCTLQGPLRTEDFPSSLLHALGIPADDLPGRTVWN